MMNEIKELLQQNLNMDFLGATLSNPRQKDGAKKVKVRPILKKEKLLFQCETHKNNQVFHDNYEIAEAVDVLTQLMESFRQMQLETKKSRYTVLVSKKGKATIQKKQQVLSKRWICLIIAARNIFFKRGQLFHSCRNLAL